MVSREGSWNTTVQDSHKAMLVHFFRTGEREGVFFKAKMIFKPFAIPGFQKFPQHFSVNSTFRTMKTRNLPLFSICAYE